MQRNVRVWSGVVLGATALFACVIVAADEGPARSLGGGVALALFLATWFLLGRRGIGDADGCGQDPRASTAATVLTIATLGIGVASLPELALMQGIIYPLIWTYALSLRRALVANAVTAVVVFAAFVIALGPEEGLLTGLVTALVSLGFSLGMGFWISSIAERSSRRQALIDELTATREQLADAHRDAGVLAERERLARDIHDTVAQSITGVVLLAQRARREQRSADATLPETLAVLEETARAALVEARSVVAALAPVELGSGGIRSALERLGERFERETGVTVIVDAPAGAELPRESEVVLLRCAQEALANVRKHAQARSVTVSLGLADARAELVVHDDGVGFDPAASALGYGLDGMRERLALAGGRLAIDSGAGGTRLAASLPVTAGVRPEVAR